VEKELIGKHSEYVTTIKKYREGDDKAKENF
jgi:hypothetical protein